MITDEQKIRQSIFEANDSVWSLSTLDKHIKTGLYEVWYIILNDIEREEAYWIRYTLMCPQTPEISKKVNVTPEEIDSLGGGAMLWFGFFSVKNPATNFIIKKSFSITQLKETTEEFIVQIADAELTLDGAKGAFKSQKGKEVKWNLKFSKLMEVYISVPVIAYKMKLSNTLLIGSNPNIQISGSISIDGIQKVINPSPGIQYHTFGDGYKVPWEWLSIHTIKGRSNAFLDIGYKINKGSIGFYDGITEYFLWNQKPLKKLAMMKKINRTKNVTEFKFTVDHDGIIIRGEITVPKEKLLGIEYKGPQGNSFYCYNSEVASAEIHLLKMDRQGNIITEQTYEATESVAFETVYDTPQEGIPYLPWTQEEL
jgi:hypothetical protein